MIDFNTEELNLIFVHNPGSRNGLMDELRQLQHDLVPGEDDDLAKLCSNVIAKLQRITDAEFQDISLYDWPEDDAYLDEDDAYGYTDLYDDGFYDEEFE